MNRRKIKELIAAWGIALILSSAASVLGIQLSKHFPSVNALPLFFILFGAFVLACIVNRMSAKSFAHKHFGMPLAARRELMTRHAEACKANPAAMLAQYKSLEFTPIFVLTIYFLSVMSITVAGSFCLSVQPPLLGFALALTSWFMGWFFLYMPLYRLFEQIPHRLDKRFLVRDGYLPTLEALAKKAAEAAGIKGPVQLEIVRDCDCIVNRFSGTYVVFFGTRLLAVLTEEEMYQCLLMTFEFYAQRKESRKIMRRYRISMLGAAHIRRETFAFDLFFSYVDASMEWEYEYCLLAFKRYIDRCAYDRIKQVGSPLSATRALCKRSMWRYFAFEASCSWNKPLYADPEPPKQYELDLCNSFRRGLDDHYGRWVDMLMKEIRPATDYSPLFRDEWPFLAPDWYASMKDWTPMDAKSPYGKEVAKAIKKVGDYLLRNEISGNYEATRQREYLEPLRITEAYEADPTGYTTPELSPIINAYRDICEYEKAEALCDRIMETETNQFALAHAIYFKGICMLHRYETEGIDLIYRAIDLNKNYMRDGFEMVEEYCTLGGLEHEYAAFHRRSDIQLSAHAYNHEVAGNLSPRDHLIKEEALGDMLPDILAYMEGAANGCIREIYLVRKVISEDFFTSAFVINFEHGTSEENLRRTYQAIFNYLDAYPVDWQFSLFVYDRATEAAVKRVEDSLVWKKK